MWCQPVEVEGVPIVLLLDEGGAWGVHFARVEHGGGGLGGGVDVQGGLADRCVVEDVAARQIDHALHPSLQHGQYQRSKEIYIYI